MTAPISLPADFDPQVGMVYRLVDGRRFHGTIPAAALAYDLVQNGTPGDLAHVENTLRSILECQETRPGHPRHGNFRWEREEPEVEDLNAVEFVMFSLIPILLQWSDRLTPELVVSMREGIEAALAEICRIDVNLRYTNIVLKDIANSCLGGSLLDDQALVQRGTAKLIDWLAFTDRSGAPTEYNSPGYTRVALRVLGRLADLTTDAATRAIARLAAARIGLSCVLHISPGTGAWAGPYSRAYLDSVFTDTGSGVGIIRDWIADGTLPAWLTPALEDRPADMTVTETAAGDNGVVVTTHHTPVFDLGIASAELTTQSNRFIALQSNVCIAHYTRSKGPTGVILSRYLLDDHWIGDYRQTPSRAASLLAEEGRFHGVQDGPRVIGVYAPRAPGTGAAGVDGWNRCRSAKAALIWDRADLIEHILVDGREVTTLPFDLPRGGTVVVCSGDVCCGVRPLTITDLGVDAPLRLVTRHGALLLEMCNYSGAEKTFWEQASPGSFFQGLPQCGFYLELAAAAVVDPVALGRRIADGTLTDKCEPAVTWERGKTRRWRVSYQRDDRELGLEVDLMTWRLEERWTADGPAPSPMLESPIARQGRGGLVVAGGAELRCGPEPAWVWGNQQRRVWAAAYHGGEPEPLSLRVPDGRVELDGMARGLIVWDRGSVSIEAETVIGKPRIEGGSLTD